MDAEGKKLLEIFQPALSANINDARNEDFKLALYTKASTAHDILLKQQAWLRNCLCMNDYSEIQHGMKCLSEAYKKHREKLKEILEDISPEIIGEIEEGFNNSYAPLRLNTHIICVSEHSLTNDKDGRLSMWRAYGGDHPVAIILNTEPFSADTNKFGAYAYRVDYKDTDNFVKDFGDYCLRVDEQKEFLKQCPKESVTNHIYSAFINMAICTKHPGFQEEQEWRVIYNPKLMKSDYIFSEIESVDGVPQEIFKIKLEKINKENIDLSISSFINKIIIGPSNHAVVMQQSFIKLLKRAGCTNAETKVYCSKIPFQKKT